ncbi:tyrosine-type recombinase/integrase [uncultured Jannaschia sp.]|uniref:tyrosine-type recombinase/integrase n=1 Tax=uncultured Jannaschia sp. TaxID=293347 RepID=UPI00341A704B
MPATNSASSSAGWRGATTTCPGSSSPSVVSRSPGRAGRKLHHQVCRRPRRPRSRPSAHGSRHSCGFALANRKHDLRMIQDWLGHRDPRHTAHYTRTAAKRFDGLW